MEPDAVAGEPVKSEPSRICCIPGCFCPLVDGLAGASEGYCYWDWMNRQLDLSVSEAEA